MSWTHNGLAHDLAMHLKDPKKMVWENMPIGPAGSPRPDVYTIQKSFSKPDPVTYEVKISTSDFRSDVTSGKWQSYLDFSGAVMFAVPKGLVSKKEVPNGCGLIVRSENGWSTHKRATRQTYKFKTEHLLKLLMRAHDENVYQMRIREASELGTAREIRQKLGDKIADIISDTAAAEYKLQITLDRIEREKQLWKNQQDSMNEKAVARAKQEVKEVKRVIEETIEALNLPPGSSAWDIQRAIKDGLERLDKNREIQRLRSLLDGIYNYLEERRPKIIKTT